MFGCFECIAERLPNGPTEGSAAWAVALNPAVPCCAEGQAICGFSHREVPPMPPTP